MDLPALKIMLDTLWVLITAFLVFFMNLGFAMVESGLCRAKNTVNILAKNFIVFAVSSLAYYLLGFGLMFGNGSPPVGEAYRGVYAALNWTGVPLGAKFFFQLVFCGTAATIVSGAVAERIKFISFMTFSIVIATLLYPITGHWIWGGGWLAAAGMLDFAGSTVVHSVGGWAALVGILLLGPRVGKYKPDGTPRPVYGHNLTTATLAPEVNLLKKVRLEIAVNEGHVQPTVEGIIQGARTGEIGDGKTFIMDLPECIRIRTGETGGVAIG